NPGHSPGINPGSLPRYHSGVPPPISLRGPSPGVALPRSLPGGRPIWTPPQPFVKPVNTIYCASVLGHSQDIAYFGLTTGPRALKPWRRLVGGGCLSTASRGAQAGCLAGRFPSRESAERTGSCRNEQARCHRCACRDRPECAAFSTSMFTV